MFVAVEVQDYKVLHQFADWGLFGLDLGYKAIRLMVHRSPDNGSILLLVQLIARDLIYCITLSVNHMIITVGLLIILGEGASVLWRRAQRGQRLRLGHLRRLLHQSAQDRRRRRQRGHGRDGRVPASSSSAAAACGNVVGSGSSNSNREAIQ